MRDRPNIIWFFDDQHRAQATSLAGDPNVSTPHLEKLAAEGVWFRRALSGNPWCTPFRGSLLTGRYCHNAVYETPSRLDPSIPTIADAFNDGGYHTAYFGKWHLARRNKKDGPFADGRPQPQRYLVDKPLRGRFAEWLAYESSPLQYDIPVHGHNVAGEEVAMHNLPGYEPDTLTDLLVDFLKRDHDKPFFAVCSIQPPHSPYDPPPAYAQRRKAEDIALRPNVPDVGDLHERWRQALAGYYGSIECIDDNLGRAMRTLRETGQYDNTYVMFFSDHGDMHGSQGLRQKSVPYEESIRVPFVIGGGAAARAAGSATDSVLNSVDIAPTTLGLAGLRPREAMPGFDYSGYATGDVPDDEPDSALCQQIVHKRHPDGMDCTWRAIVTRDGWKYICTENAPIGMYNLNEDPYERKNLVFDHGTRDRRAALLARLAEWLDDVGDVYPLPVHR